MTSCRPQKFWSLWDNMYTCDKTEIMCWTGGLPHFAKLSQLPGVPYVHVNSTWSQSRLSWFSEWGTLLGWLSIEQLLQLRDVTMVFKCVNNLVPIYLCNKLSKRSEIHKYSTRHCSDLNLGLCQTEAAKWSFFYRVVIHFNDLTSDTRSANSVSIFFRVLPDVNCSASKQTLISRYLMLSRLCKCL